MSTGICPCTNLTQCIFLGVFVYSLLVYIYMFYALKIHLWQPLNNFSVYKNISEHSPKTKSHPRRNLSWCENLQDVYPLVTNFTEILTDNESLTEKGFCPVNTLPFDYIRNPHNICKSTKRIHILSVVKSAVPHFKMRSVIRETWGKIANSGRNKLIFLLGSSVDHIGQYEREFATYRDSIIGDFKDNYYNNTLKTSMGLRWIDKYCANTHFVFFVDDDVMVNFKNVIIFFNNTKPSDEPSLFSGNLLVCGAPSRNNASRWYMPESVFPYDCYPPFLSGFVTLTTGKVVHMLSRALPYVKSFRYDDVYLGIIAQKIGIHPIHNKYVSANRVFIRKMVKMIACHGFSDANYYRRMYNNFL